MATNGKKGRRGNGASASRRRGRKNLRGRAKGGMPRWLAALFVLGLIGFIGALVVMVAAYAYYQRYADQLVAPDELAINQPSYGAKIYDRNGKLLYEYVDDKSGLRRPIKLDAVSQAFLAATISTEDDSFFTNPGVNIKGLGRAVWENFSPFSSTPGVFAGSGGSSITQQLVKNVYIGQESAQGVAQIDKSILDLKGEIAKLQGTTGVNKPYDSAAEIEAMRAELQQLQGTRPSLAVSQQLDFVTRLQAKETERDLVAEEVQTARQSRSVDRKLKEIVYAIELTNRYSKSQILEWYVNQISYGGVYNGVEAASQGYFGKPASQLTLAEAALLAGIPQSPAAYDPVNHPEDALARRNQILDLMHRQGKIRIGEDTYFELTEEQVAVAKAEPVDIAVKRFPIEAPHFVLQYVEPQLVRLFGKDALYHDGLIVTTSLDLDLQRRANEILEEKIVAQAPGTTQSYEQISNSHNGGVIVIDPKTGEVLTLVGSRDYFREDIQGKNNNMTALNSPGSSFKPFVYMTAFMKLKWGPGSFILDTPVTFKQPDGKDFTPSNPTHNFQGLITVRNALGNSLNIPADKTADATGVDNVVQTAKKMGFTSLTGSYGPAIATGGVDITGLDQAFAYSVMANGGIMRGMKPLAAHRSGERELDPIAILKVEDAQKRVRFDVSARRAEQRIVPEEYPALITSILTDASSQCITFGCGGISVPGYQVAVKTGTSEPYDSPGPNAGKIGETWGWGYTPDIVVGIWAGNSDQTTPGPFTGPVTNIFSTSIAFRSMRDTLLAFYHGRPQTAFRRPEGVVEGTVCVPSGMKPTPLCGKTTTDLLAKDSLPKDDDTWWQRVNIDGRTGLLASGATPPQFIQQQVMLVLPKEMLQTDDDKAKAKEWADALGIPLAPTETSPGGGSTGPTADLPAVIFSPIAGQTVAGLVQVFGRASTSAFQGYRLEYGQGSAPATWTQISLGTGQVGSGPLGIWNTQNLAAGPYTLRLVVQDRTAGQIIASVTVNVGAPSPTPVPTGTPPARP